PFTFRQPEEITSELRTTIAQQTIRETANVPVWMLVADIENFTPLSRSMVSDKLATLVGGWVSTCKQIVEDHHGEIDKYLGDGFLAYWHEDEKSAENVAAGLEKLKQIQKSEPRFRLVLHYGLVSSGGMRSMGEESLIGKEVIFVFRMEKLAGTLGIHLLASAAAQTKLGGLIVSQPAGSHELKGFDGRVRHRPGRPIGKLARTPLDRYAGAVLRISDRSVGPAALELEDRRVKRFVRRRNIRRVECFGRLSVLDHHREGAVDRLLGLGVGLCLGREPGA